MALSGPVYFTPTELLTRAPLGAIPRSEIPGPMFTGKRGPVVPTGASTGRLIVGGYPIDVYDVIIRVAVGGDIGTAQFEVSIDGGTTYGDPYLTSTNNYQNIPAKASWQTEITYTGLNIRAENGSGTPNSFLAGDTWTLTTTASEKLLQVCGVLSDWCRKWYQNTGQPVTDIDEASREMWCWLGRWLLCAGRGDVPEDWKRLAELAEKTFKLESTGDIHQNSTPDPDGFVFPQYERARGSFRFNYPGTCIPVWRH